MNLGPFHCAQIHLDYLCVFCVFFYTAYVLYYCENSGVDLMGLKPNPLNLFSSVL